MEYAMDKEMVDGIKAKLAAEKASSNTAYDFPNQMPELYLKPADVTATYFAAVDLT